MFARPAFGGGGIDARDAEAKGMAPRAAFGAGGIGPRGPGAMLLPSGRTSFGWNGYR
jgi:hypothetical protein